MLQLVDVPHYSYNLYFTVAYILSVMFLLFMCLFLFLKWKTNSIDYLYL